MTVGSARVRHPLSGYGLYTSSLPDREEVRKTTNLKKESRPFIDDSADVLDELFHPTYDCLAGLDVCLR
jgi:hypothetical protein